MLFGIFIFFCKQKGEFLPPKNHWVNKDFGILPYKIIPSQNLFIGSPSKGETKICSFYVVLNFEEIALG